MGDLEATIAIRRLAGGYRAGAAEHAVVVLTQSCELRRLNRTATDLQEGVGGLLKKFAGVVAGAACDQRAVGIELPSGGIPPVLASPLEVELENVWVVVLCEVVLENIDAALHLIAQIVHGERADIS